MKSKTSFLIAPIGILCCILVLSCNDLVDRKLSDSVVVVDNPSDSFVTSNYSVTFLWEKVTGAGNYHLQIVQPGFSNIQQFVLDTLIQDAKLTYTMLPGVYQWRIRAENGSTNSLYTTRNLRIDTNSNLNGQQFTVLSPLNNYTTNNTILAFRWMSFPYAHKYEFVLLDSNGLIFHDKYTFQQVLVDTIPEGTYSWKARAFDTANGTGTQFSVANMLIIDLTPPIAAVPQLPANNSQSTTSTSFSWSHASDVYGDSILIASDSLFQTIPFSNFVIGSTSYSQSALVVNQVYYWRLRSRDQAGNWSSNSPIFKFTVK